MRGATILIVLAAIGGAWWLADFMFNTISSQPLGLAWVTMGVATFVMFVRAAFGHAKEISGERDDD